MQDMSPDMKRWQRRTLMTLFIGYGGYYVCRSNLSVALPLIHDEFNLTKEDTGTIAAIGVFLYAIGKVTNGVISDFFGGRMMFVLGMLASVCCTVAFGVMSGILAWTVVWAINRYFQSMGWVSLVKIAARWFPVHRHATTLGILSMSYLIGDAVARAYLGAFIGIGFGWRGVFMVSAVTFMAIALFSVFTLKSSPRDVGLEEPPVNQTNVFGASGEQSRPEGVWPLLVPLLRNPTFWLICGINFGLTYVRETFNLWNPTFLHEVSGVDIKNAALGSLLFPLVGAVSAFLAGRFSDRLKGRHGRIIFPALVLLVVTLTVLAYADLEGKPGLSLLLTSLVAFFLIAPYSFLSGVMALDLGGKKGTATTAGFVDSAGYLGGMLGIYLTGKIAEEQGWSAAFGILAAICGGTAVIALIYWIHHERTPLRTDEVDDASV
jgi:OPA family glycerol-3-phosphate transporter-like MFS transporter